MRGTSSGTRFYLPACLVLVAVYFALPDSLLRAGVWAAFGTLVVAAIVVGIARNRPPHPLPWLLIAVSQASTTVGDTIGYGAEMTAGDGTVPPLADLWYLLSYPFLGAGLLIFIRRRTPEGDRSALLDGMIVTIGLGLVSWVFLIQPVLTQDLEMSERMVAAAYPAADLLILAVCARLWADRGRRAASFLLLLGALVSLLIGDTLYAVGSVVGTWQPGGLADVFYATYGLALGVAALRPSMVELDRPVSAEPTKITTLRFGTLQALSSLLVPAVVVVQWTRGGREFLPLVGIVAAVLFVLVLVRMAGLITALHELNRQDRENHFHRLTRQASDVIIICDLYGVVRYLTPAIERVFGWPEEAVRDRALLEFLHPDDAGRLGSLFRLLPESGTTTPMRCRVRTPTGDWLHGEAVATWLTDGDVRGYLLTARNVTDQVRLEEELTHQAFHDSLTGLANRALFLERVTHGLERRSQVHRNLAVLLLDLDDFKTVNDSLGPAAGDELLRAVGERVKGCLRTADTAARLGGDEFALLVEEIGDPAEAAPVATRVLAALQKPFVVHGREVVVHGSVGIAVADPDRVPDAEELLRNADVAMYTAKQEGKDRYNFYAPSMHAGLIKRLDLTAELRTAIDRRDFQVHYQPIVNLPDGSLRGVEALVRWPHRTRGLVSPVEFIPLAEDTGLIVPLGADVLAEACAQVAQWRRERPGFDMTVSVNLSPRQVNDPGVVRLVRDALTATDLEPRALCLEITESVLTEDGQIAVERLIALKELGVRLAVDDFGTGYSSLSRLNQLPIDILKIPKPFVDGVTEGPTASALARAILELSSALELAVVAEGIEHPEQAEVLYNLGCRLAQGYHFGRPATAADLERRLPEPVKSVVAAGGEPLTSLA
ncbi:hypothetical protein Val02_91430 [Virgisporangium aliadipatigenens]|uniref:Uncharacterized protein n=1 Tax=Virgisporangium aliadipatigenens TaxID=741659 RepID=A0A8J4DXN2_9ACTN|nr:EAL domain-containing protein [Virgisporangium aliadipatigenens]GIJ52257.1 hypothetical protein Val02_91430 [Virgisporangium aliadipatigenens]